jgi:hypothetical protein
MRYAFPVIAMLVAVSPPAAAQQPTDSAVPVAASPPAVRVVPVHSEEFLRRALDDARMHERDAEATLRRATEEREQAKARIEVKKRELATIDARRKLADKEKNESAKAALKVERRAAEAERKLAERLDAVYQSEIELARKTRELAEADQKMLEVELELVARRRERERLPPTDAAAAQRLDQVVIALERKVLEARRAHAAVAKDVAGREEKIAERRIDLFKANLEASGMSER